ncbi:hypothetical protein EVAR_17693_1 [Eumeta japonica]|uniref:Uncharacterized protein n=1 Tax=Eumeta variegata TaxID=151549 RepID=A0A4C1URS2_EUMVA|nr:hypothetical protein EVAR_17693_1 [Eumeta japonica]
MRSRPDLRYAGGPELRGHIERWLREPAAYGAPLPPARDGYQKKVAVVAQYLRCMSSDENILGLARAPPSPSTDRLLYTPIR